MIRLLIWAGVVLALLAFFYNSLDGGGVRKEAQRGESAVPVEKGANASVAAVAAAPPTARNPDAPVVAPSEPAPTAAPVVAPIAPIDKDRSRPVGRGLSFALADASTVPAGVAHLACHGEPAPSDRPHRGSCNPYEGDTSCRIRLPIACYRSSGAVAPLGLAQDFYKGWVRGQLAATRPS